MAMPAPRLRCLVGADTGSDAPDDRCCGTGCGARAAAAAAAGSAGGATGRCAPAVAAAAAGRTASCPGLCAADSSTACSGVAAVYGNRGRHNSVRRCRDDQLRFRGACGRRLQRLADQGCPPRRRRPAQAGVQYRPIRRTSARRSGRRPARSSTRSSPGRPSSIGGQAGGWWPAVCTAPAAPVAAARAAADPHAGASSSRPRTPTECRRAAGISLVMTCTSSRCRSSSVGPTRVSAKSISQEKPVGTSTRTFCRLRSPWITDILVSTTLYSWSGSLMSGLGSTMPWRSVAIPSPVDRVNCLALGRSRGARPGPLRPIATCA